MQHTEQWHIDRLGKITASRIKDLNAKPVKGKVLNRYLLELLNERLTGLKTQTLITQDMQWGIDHEKNAITAYENRHFCTVIPSGFINHPTIKNSGASPDGLVGDDGQIEIKCPSMPTHLNTLLLGEIPSDHLPQITWQLAVTRRKWCDFISYDPRQIAPLQIFVKRVFAKDLPIANMEQDVIACNDRLDNLIGNLLTG